MTKKVTCIQFLHDRVILEFEQGQVFQFCKQCQNGQHLKAFLNYFCPEINLQALDMKLAQLCERRFYFLLSKSGPRFGIKRLAHELGEFIAARQARERDEAWSVLDDH